MRNLTALHFSYRLLEEKGSQKFLISNEKLNITISNLYILFSSLRKTGEFFFADFSLIPFCGIDCEAVALSQMNTVLSPLVQDLRHAKVCRMLGPRFMFSVLFSSSILQLLLVQLKLLQSFLKLGPCFLASVLLLLFCLKCSNPAHSSQPHINGLFYTVLS